MSLLKYRRVSKKREKPKEDSPSCSTQTFISFLKKKPQERITHIKEMVDFLSENYDYFIKIKHMSDNDKLARIAIALNYEYFSKGEKIINCGDSGDKFYIVIQGKVSVCKPIPYSANIAFRDYVEYIHHIKHIEKNHSKFRRIISQNAQIDHYALDKIGYDYTQLKFSKKSQTYILENEKKLSEFGSGFPFGELALIKREPRNATVYAIENTVLASLDKLDYNRILREIEEKRLEKKASEFVRKFPLFKQWGVGQLFRMFNYFEKTTLFSGDYLYKQNEASEYIYFVNSGIFEMSSVFSFAWYEEFVDYIHDSSFNIADRMLNKAQFSNDENLKSFLKSAQDEIVSPCIMKTRKQKPTVSFEEKALNVLDIKMEEDSLKKSKHLFKAKIKSITIPECLGYEDGLELKPRYTSVKCISHQADIDKIHLVEFIKLLPSDTVNQEIFQRNIFEKKLVLIQQLKNNAMLQLANIDSRLRDKYRKAVEKDHLNQSKPKKYSNDKQLMCSSLFNNQAESRVNNVDIGENNSIDEYIKNDPLLKSHIGEESGLNKISSLFQDKTYLNRNNKKRLFNNGSTLMLRKINKSMIDISARGNSESENNNTNYVHRYSQANDIGKKKGSYSKIREMRHKKLEGLSNRIIEANTTELMTKGNSLLSLYLNNNSNNYNNNHHHHYGHYRTNISVKAIILKRENFKSLVCQSALPDIKSVLKAKKSDTEEKNGRSHVKKKKDAGYSSQ